MEHAVYFVNMFPDYVPPEALNELLSQAAICAADIDPENRTVELRFSSDRYIPHRVLEEVSRDVATIYGLKALIIEPRFPSSAIVDIEP